MLRKPLDSSGVSNDNSKNSASIFGIEDGDLLSALGDTQRHTSDHPQDLDLSLFQDPWSSDHIVDEVVDEGSVVHIVGEESIPLTQEASLSESTTTTSTSPTLSPNVNSTAQIQNADGDRINPSNNPVKTHIVKSNANDLLGAHGFIIRGPFVNLMALRKLLTENDKFRFGIKVEVILFELKSESELIITVKPSVADLYVNRLRDFLQDNKNKDEKKLFTVSEGIVNKVLCSAPKPQTVNMSTHWSTLFQPRANAPQNTNAMQQTSEQSQRFNPYGQRQPYAKKQ